MMTAKQRSALGQYSRDTEACEIGGDIFLRTKPGADHIQRFIKDGDALSESSQAWPEEANVTTLGKLLDGSED